MKANLEINGKEYIAEIFETEEDREKGLQGRGELDSDKAALFVFEKEEEQSFWMHDTNIALDIIFIGTDWIVNSVYRGVPNSDEVMSDTARYVLEVNQGSGIKPGDEIEVDYSEEIYDKLEVNKMYVLDAEGNPQVELQGGERIFSIPNVKIMVKLAKKAHLTKKDKDYKALGKKIFEFLDTQDSTPEEYVTKPE